MPSDKKTNIGGKKISSSTDDEAGEDLAAAQQGGADRQTGAKVKPGRQKKMRRASTAGQKPAQAAPNATDSEPPGDPPADSTSAPETQQDRIRHAIKDTQILIWHAAIVGKEVPAELIETIAAAALNYRESEFSPADEAEFWSAVAKVSRLVAPITIESILYTRATKKRMRERDENASGIDWFGWIVNLRHVTPYLIATIAVLGVLLYFQIDWVRGTNLSGEIDRLTQRQSALALELAQLDLRIQTAGDPGATDQLKIERDAKQKELASKTSALTASRLLLVEWVSSYDSDPELPIEPGLFSSEQMREEWKQKLDQWRKQSKQIQESRADLTYQKAQAILQNFADYILPLLYGLLGSFTYVLRALSREISGISFSRGSHVQFMLRLLLGLLAGISVGWFLRPESDMPGVVEISPFALAFLAGYSVELVFTAMDKIVNSFSGGSAAEKSS